MLPTGRTFKTLMGFRRTLVPDTRQVWGKEETAAGNRQIEEIKEILYSCLLCFTCPTIVSATVSAPLCPYFVQNTRVCGRRNGRCRNARIRCYRQYPFLRCHIILLKGRYSASINKTSALLTTPG